MRTVIGVDPDSDRHGIAIYQGGSLKELAMWNLPDVIDYLDRIKTAGDQMPIFSIENVLANNFVYTRNSRANKAAHAKVALSVGRCQQSQAELMRILDRFGAPYQTVNPTKENTWAKNKSAFERFTGWTRKSNADTRSAAFFGFLLLNRSTRKSAGARP